MTDQRPHVLSLDRTIPLDQAAAVARGARGLILSAAAVARLAEGHRRLQAVIAGRRHVYGLTTGFGPLADRLVDPADGVTLQQNLVHHLASGVGPALDWDEARAMVLARLMSIVQGLSGASPAVAEVLVALLNSPYAPEIPARGTVGASGDLTPLAHMVLCLQGRGRLLTRDGARLDAAAVVGTALPRLDLAGRDGLALVNGTSAMTGCALLTSADAAEALGVAVALSATLAEVQRGRIEAWHPAFARHRPHPGQARIAAALRARVAGSDRVERRPVAATVLAEAETRGAPSGRRIGQDAYTLRCVPQVLGAVADTLDWHDRVVATELHAVTDNPLFPPPSEDEPGLPPALHGGNFMGQHVGLVSDALSTAVIVMAGLAERQVARLTDERLNDGLPAFLHRGAPGLNSGFMGAQVTATALLAELRAGAGAASVQSISTNGANQDVVSMGTIAARMVRQRLDLTRQIHAILALVLAQAMELRADEGRASGPAGRSGAGTGVEGGVARGGADAGRTVATGQDSAVAPGDGTAPGHVPAGSAGGGVSLRAPGSRAVPDASGGAGGTTDPEALREALGAGDPAVAGGAHDTGAGSGGSGGRAVNESSGAPFDDARARGPGARFGKAPDAPDARSDAGAADGDGTREAPDEADAPESLADARLPDGHVTPEAARVADMPGSPTGVRDGDGTRDASGPWAAPDRREGTGAGDAQGPRDGFRPHATVVARAATHAPDDPVMRGSSLSSDQPDHPDNPGSQAAHGALGHAAAQGHAAARGTVTRSADVAFSEDADATGAGAVQDAGSDGVTDRVPPLPGFSPGARALHAFVRQVSPPLETDRPLGPEITALAEALRGDPGSSRWRVQAA